MEMNNSGDTGLVIWDEADVLKRVMGNKQILDVLVESFLNDMPDYAQSLSDNLARKDLQAAAGSAHALKGVAGNVSTLALAEAVKRVELACRSPESMDQILALHSDFETIFEQTCEVLSAWQASQN